MASLTTSEILEALHELPAEDRARIAKEAVRSLGEDVAEEGVEEAWRAEIEKRIEDVVQGRVELLDGPKVFEELRAELRATRK